MCEASINVASLDVTLFPPLESDPMLLESFLALELLINVASLNPRGNGHAEDTNRTCSIFSHLFASFSTDLEN